MTSLSQTQSLLVQRHGGVLLEDPVKIYEHFPPSYGTTLREKRQAMRDVMAGKR